MSALYSHPINQPIGRQSWNRSVVNDEEWADLTNNHIWFLNREDGKVVGQMGSMGENGGQWFGLHMIAVDSRGNIYTGEVFNGERGQRFVPAR